MNFHLMLWVYLAVNIVDKETPEMLERTMSMNDESIDELFATTFDGIRSTVTDAINKIIDFIGE